MSVELKLRDVVIPRDKIARRVREIADEITAAYKSEELVVVGVLKGSVIFVSDIVRKIGPEVDVRLDFISVSSYGDSTSPSGEVRILKDLDVSPEGHHILLVDDILDTGRTLSRLVSLINARNPKSVRTCVLAEKPARKKTDFTPDYVGFTVPDVFIVGYGMDWAGRMRNLPDINFVSE
ncbi:hypoxanthine phosphoribosyltransferase [Synergistales bacterium]|nr:hypoxanthine phosphoribosyltransferase [Synergistales bacterium]